MNEVVLILDAYGTKVLRYRKNIKVSWFKDIQKILKFLGLRAKWIISSHMFIKDCIDN